MEFDFTFVHGIDWWWMECHLTVTLDILFFFWFLSNLNTQTKERWVLKCVNICVTRKTVSYDIICIAYGIRIFFRMRWMKGNWQVTYINMWKRQEQLPSISLNFTNTENITKKKPWKRSKHKKSLSQYHL